MWYGLVTVTELADPVARSLREIIAPLVEADGGVLYLVVRADGALHLHLSGACAGCPGARTTINEVIEPALRAAGLRIPLEVTCGWTVPTGAERCRPPGAP